MTIDQISIFVENKPAKLADILEELGNAGVNLHAMAIADTADFGILRIIADDPQQVKQKLGEAGYVASINQVIAVAVPDAPGGLAKVSRVLADAGMSIEYIYAIIAHGKENAYVIIRVEDNDKALDVLNKNSVKVVTRNELCNL